VEIARTLVGLGVEMPVRTRSTPQSGIVYSLSVSGEMLAAPSSRS
jgi:hypothetical protein